jgi:protein subunit release factor B
MIKDLENIILVASDELQSFVDKNRDDLSWDSHRPKGGQQVGVVRSDITLEHMPTGK